MDYQNRQRDQVDARRVLKNLESSDNQTLLRGVEAASGFTGNEDICRALIRLLSHKDDEVRWKSAAALGQIQMPFCSRYLELSLHDPVPKVRSAAADSLGKLKAYGSAYKIVNLLKDHSPEVRYSACEALGMLQFTDATTQVAERLSDPEEIVRLGAAESLGRLKSPTTVPLLERALEDEFHLVRAYAAESLGRIGVPTAKGALLKRLPKETAARAQLGIHTALYMLGDPSHLMQMVSFLTHENPLARRAAAANLTELSDQMTAGSLLVYFKRALQVEKQKQTREALEQAVEFLSAREKL